MEHPTDDAQPESDADRTSMLERLFKALMTLTTSRTSVKSCPEDECTEFLSQVLKENVQALIAEIEKSSQLQADLGHYSGSLLQCSDQLFPGQKDISPRDKYVEICLCLLSRITNTLYEISKSSTDIKCESCTPKLDPCVLSAPQLKTLSTSLQFIVVLGVCPYLSPGVGIPVSQRLGPGQVLLATPFDYSSSTSHLARIQSLLPPVKLLCDMLDAASLRDTVINHHFGDLLAALFQLRFSTRAVQQHNEAAQCTQTPVEPCGGKNVKAHDDLPNKVGPSSVEPPSVASLTEPLRNQVGGSSKPLLAEPVLVYSATAIVLPEVYLHSSDQPWTLGLVREHCNRCIDKAVRLSSTQHVLKTLMVLSSGGKPNSMSVPVKPPAWYRRTVAALLRDVLIMANGVQHLIALLVNETPDGLDWQKCKAVAQVIAQLPTTPGNCEEFHRSITSQLLAIVQSEPGPHSPLVIRAVGATILELNTHQPAYMESFCFSQLFEPLLRISGTSDRLHQLKNDEVVSEYALTSCIISLHRVFVLGQEPMSPLCNKLKTVVGALCALLLASRQGVSPLKSKCHELLGAYIGQCDPPAAVSCLLAMVTGTSDLEIRRDVCLTAGQQGWLQAMRAEEAGPGELNMNIDSWTQHVDSVMDVLSSVAVRKDNLIPQLFISLLQKLTSIVKTESRSTEDSDIVLPVRLLSCAQRTKRQAELREKICLVSLLAALGDKYGDGVVSCGGHVLQFCLATLERCVQICQACSDEATMTFEWETVSMAMGLLTAVLSGGVEIGDQSSLLDELLPLLNYISASEAADPRVREMADDLKVAVATKGLVWAELSKMRSTHYKNECKQQAPSKSKAEEKKKSLIEVLSETTLDESEKDTEEDKRSDNEEGSSRKSPLEQALAELCDPMLPVRGHGLIALARLVEERSPEVKDKKDVLLKVFLENLSHSDSYIYLASVNGLAALSDLCPDQVIPCLASELRTKGLAQQHQPGREDSTATGELALKLGEALVKATRRLGELTPKYRDTLLSSILCVCRRSDPITRASCLSGLAEVCQLLRFALGPVLHEVVACCRDVISCDPDPQPRKAAALTFTLILRGLGKESLLAFGDVLTGMYRVLKQAAHHDPEEGVRIHAGLALEELDAIMREALFAKPQLSKKITILGHQ